MRVPCPQCGAEVQLREAAGFPACPYCSVSLVLDPTGVRPHFLYRPRIRTPEVLPLVRRWADRQRLPAPSPASPPRLAYLPFWRYAVKGAIRFVPAWETLAAHWDALATPEAEQIFFDPEQVRGASVTEATLPELSARRRLRQPEHLEAGDLVHLPFFEVEASLAGHQATIVLDACSGRVYTDRQAGLGSAAAGPGDAGVILAASGLLLAAVFLPALLAVPVMAGLAGWLWLRMATDRRTGVGQPTD